MKEAYMPMLAMRGPVHLILNLVGRLAGFGCVVCAGIFMTMGQSFTLHLALFSGAVWYGAFWLRMRYDAEILKRVPEGQSLSLYQ